MHPRTNREPIASFDSCSRFATGLAKLRAALSRHSRESPSGRDGRATCASVARPCSAKECTGRRTVLRGLSGFFRRVHRYASTAPDCCLFVARRACRRHRLPGPSPSSSLLTSIYRRRADLGRQRPSPARNRPRLAELRLRVGANGAAAAADRAGG
jgi:hypothetical protein